MRHINIRVSSSPGKTLVIGALGFIGRRIFHAYCKLYPETIGTHYLHTQGMNYLNLLVPSIRDFNLSQGEYKYAFIAAANTNLALCEMEKTSIFRKNVEGILQLSYELVKLGITPILLSSDYVFDGIAGGYTETSKTYPINEYGRQKELLEKKISEVCGDNYLIIRCSKVYGLDMSDGSLIDQIGTPLLQGNVVKAAYDQIFAPLFVDDFIQAVFSLQSINARGLYNLCGNEVWTRLNLAVAIAKCLEVDDNLIEPISLDNLNRPYRLPKRTDMRCDKFYETTSTVLTPLSKCLEQVKTWRMTCKH